MNRACWLPIGPDKRMNRAMTPLVLRGGQRGRWSGRRRVRIPGNEHNSSIPRVLEFAGTQETPAERILRRFFSADWARIRAGSVLGVVGYAGRGETSASPAQLVKLRLI